ncbi:MAG: IclR family transcriptional regulator C-terminal domain-containing protein [Parabacteroides sp.]
MLRPGTSFCLHASAPGKIFLAYLSDEEREKAMQTIQYTVIQQTYDSRANMQMRKGSAASEK